MENFERAAIKNRHFRKVLYTDKFLQITVMSIPTREDIGLEVHKDTTQTIRVSRGDAEAVIGKTRLKLTTGDMVVIPYGSKHNIINTGENSLKLVSSYSPPVHGADSHCYRKCE